MHICITWVGAAASASGRHAVFLLVLRTEVGAQPAAAEAGTGRAVAQCAHPEAQGTARGAAHKRG